MWAVDASGILGYVTDPDHALEALGEALADLADARESRDPGYAAMSSLRSAVNAFGEYAAAFLAEVAPVSIRQLKDSQAVIPESIPSRN
ncbi:hypothetical protein QZN11_40515 [Streptomyces gramineus]|uniref:hypothetical protein n=1 Tax=Streptomyces gramineus TaxID=910542 RepID=UPI00398AEE1C